jgi:hypothetical protein
MNLQYQSFGARDKDGMMVDDESLAVALIDKIGLDGTFLGTKHTLEHLRKDVWFPQLADRNIADNWMKLAPRTCAKEQERRSCRYSQNTRCDPSKGAGERHRAGAEVILACLMRVILSSSVIIARLPPILHIHYVA